MLNIKIIFLIFIIPVVGLGFFIIAKNFLLQEKFNKNPLARLRNYNFSRALFLMKNIFLAISFLLIALSLLRPQWGLQKTTGSAKGIDIIFTLDVSKSMKAIDMDIDSNELSRLSMSKSMIENFIKKNPQNRYGLVIFAGEAFVITPLTIDHESFLTFLSGVTYDNVGKQGTDLSKALKASIDRFNSNDNEKRGRSIVIISDGGEVSENNFEDFAKVAEKEDINIFTIGVGDTKEVPIPEGKDFFGKIIYKKYQGKIVMTKLNEAPLKKIAKLTNGKYFHAKKKNDLEKISQDIKNLQSTIIKKQEREKKEDRYQYFLFPAFLLFCFFIFVPAKKNTKLKLYRNKILNKYFKFSMLILMMLPLSGCSVGDTFFRYYNARANESISKNYFQEGRDNYKKAQDFSDELKHIAQNNQSIIDYQDNQFEKVEIEFQKTIDENCTQNTKQYCDQIYYNQGNNYYRLGEMEENSENQKILHQLKGYPK